VEPYIAEQAALKRTERELSRLNDLIRECKQFMGGDLLVIVRKNEIEFHKTIAAITENPILILITDFIRGLLIDTKGFLLPSREFSQWVLEAHKRIYTAILEKNAQKARIEMLRHVEEVRKDLLAIQKTKSGLKKNS
jgi:DNA-binding FadR family transcriptional regulator